MSLAGNSSGDGFLVAPRGTTYDAELALSTDAGTLSVALQASPNAASLVFSQTAVNLSTTPTIVTIHSTLQSASRGDTTIQVLDGATVVASFTITSIKRPVVNFRGRFEARFATDPAFYNQNPMYSATVNNVGPGWTWGLEGEPDFVPAVGNVPENLETPVGRVVRYNNPVALRSHAAPVVSTVTSITGETSSGTETFTTGDPLIGQQVDLGPNTYLASNNASNPSEPRPEENWAAAREPMALFELHLGNHFSGASQVGPFTHKATTTNEKTRSPDSRPISNGFPGAAAELAEFGLPLSPEPPPTHPAETFSENRIDELVTDYNALPAGDTPQRRNLVRRIGHLLSSVSPAKRTAVQNANPGAFTVRTLTLPQGWSNKEIYTGMVDANLVFNPGGSSVVAYLSEFNLFKFESHMFAFHSDELCGHHKGTLTPHRLSGGSYVGDPHTHTVDGTSYNFQSVGEFTLLRDGNRMEIQVRQTPVPAANPVTDSYSGLPVCVSVITAVAARVGEHVLSLQPAREGRWLQFFLDGKPADFPPQGINLGIHRATAFDANGETGLRVDYEDGTVFTATPAFWSSYNTWYFNVDVSHTGADEGIMGLIPNDSWLPRLRDGTSVDPMPASLQDRYVTHYKTFADSWRVSDTTSLFVYEPGTSTETYTDLDWPAEKPPCELKPEFQIPGAQVLPPIPIEEAEMICREITMEDLHGFCVFDVATTGDETFAKGYHLAQELMLYGTKVEIAGHEAPRRPDRLPVETPGEPENPPDLSIFVTATVSPLTPGRPTPTGSVTFFVDGVPMNRTTTLDERGWARITIGPLKPGEHTIRATYSGGGRYDYHSSSSPNLLHTVAKEKAPERVLGRWG
jgi:hypothetical protein